MIYLMDQELAQVASVLRLVSQWDDLVPETPALLSMEIRFTDYNGDYVGKIGYNENHDYAFFAHQEGLDTDG